MHNRFTSNEPPTAKRYMESPDWAELHGGVSAAAVAAKAAFLTDCATRSLLFCLQALSLRPGGFHALTEQLLSEYPQQIGTPTMHAHRIKEEAPYPARLLADIEEEINPRAYFEKLADTAIRGRYRCEPLKQRTREELIADCREAAREYLPTFLLALCVNPKLSIYPPKSAGAQTYRERVKRQYDEVTDYQFEEAKVGYFKDLVPTLYDFAQRHAARAQREFVMTEVAERVFATLDVALESPERIAMLEGREGVGKSECAKAWCDQHLGVARYISLSGITNRTAFMGTLARALGIPTRVYAAAQLQTRIEEVLQQTKLMLVIDEAHYLFGASDRFRTAPELVNWTYTTCSNFGVPVALLTTAMFGVKMRQAEKQVVWNAGQFERRVRPYVRLPDAPRLEDLQAVAQKLLPSANKPTINLAVGYAGATRFPYTNLADAIKDARRIAGKAGRAEPILADMKCAILECRGPSDKATAEAFRAPETRRVRRACTPHATPVQDTPEPTAQRDTFAGIPPAENSRFATAISGRTEQIAVTD